MQKNLMLVITLLSLSSCGKLLTEYLYFHPEDYITLADQYMRDSVIYSQDTLINLSFMNSYILKNDSLNSEAKKLNENFKANHIHKIAIALRTYIHPFRIKDEDHTCDCELTRVSVLTNNSKPYYIAFQKRVIVNSIVIFSNSYGVRRVSDYSICNISQQQYPPSLSLKN